MEMRSVKTTAISAQVTPARQRDTASRQGGELDAHKHRGYVSWALLETLWLLKTGFVLVWSMGWGIIWIIRLVRMLVYTLVMSKTVLGVMWYYMNSPTIFRRVVYRTSAVDGEQSDDVGSKNNRAYLDLHFPVHTAEILRARFTKSKQEEVGVRPTAAATIIGTGECPDLSATYPVRSSGTGNGTQHHRHPTGESLYTEGSSGSGPPSPTVPFPAGAVGPPTTIHHPGAGVPRRSDSQTPGGSLTKPFPVLVCITGGAWIIGAHYWGIPLARLFADNGYLCVCPDYRNFPQTTVGGMVTDVTDAICWVMNNIEMYGGDPTQVTLLGQSAGGHLMLQSVVEQVELLAKGLEPKYDPRLLHRVVGLSGIYNLEKIKPTLHARGLHEKVQDLMFESNHRYYSPTLRIEKLSNADFDAYFPHSVALIHGVNDSSAPWQESDSLAAILQKKCTRLNHDRKKNTERALSNSPPPSSLDRSDSAAFLQVGHSRTFSGTSVNTTSPTSPQKAPRTAHLYLMPEATHTSPYVDDPIMQKSQVIEIICTLDNNPEPRLGVRPAESHPWVLAIGKKFMAF